MKTERSGRCSADLVAYYNVLGSNGTDSNMGLIFSSLLFDLEGRMRNPIYGIPQYCDF